MCSLHHLLGEKAQLYQSWRPLDIDVIEVSEIWGDEEPLGTTRTAHSTIRNEDIEKWLEDTARAKGTSGAEKCLLRIVWVTLSVKEHTYNAAAHAVARVVQEFELQRVEEHASSCYTWSTCVSLDEPESRSFYFGKRPMLGVTWSRRGASTFTNGICFAKGSRVKALREMLDDSLAKKLVRNEELLWILCAVLLSKEVTASQDKIKDHVREVEVRTGYHNWQSRREQAAPGDLNSLSAKMSGCLTKTASIVKKVEVVHGLVNFVEQESAADDVTQKPDNNTHQNLKPHVRILAQRVKSQRLEAEFFAQRVKSQLTALFHLIAQNDNILSHELAKDSRLLALAAQRDSSSMRSLTVITMFFLPGTFVSSLFSAQLFNFGSADAALQMYLTTSLPLTLLTFAAFGLWLYVQSLQGRKRRADAQALLLRQELKATEVDALAKRRITTLVDS